MTDRCESRTHMDAAAVHDAGRVVAVEDGRRPGRRQAGERLDRGTGIMEREPKHRNTVYVYSSQRSVGVLRSEAEFAVNLGARRALNPRQAAVGLNLARFPSRVGLREDHEP